MTAEIKERLTSERGFTLIEVLASMVLLVIGLFALVASFDQARGLGNQSESQVAATAVAEKQLESGLALPFTKLALTTTPLTTGSTLDQKWNNVLNYGTETAGSTVTPIVPNPSTGNNCTSVTSPGFTGYTETLPNIERQCLNTCASISGDACTAVGLVTPYITVSDSKGNRYEVYRYVTWVNDVPCGLICLNPGLPTVSTPANTNPWFGDYKRLTVAVQVLARATGTGATLPYQGLQKPVVVNAVKIDPSRITANGTTSTLPPCLQPGVVC